MLVGGFSKKLLPLLCFLICIVALGIYFLWSLFTTEIMTEEGPMPSSMQWFLSIAVAFVCCSWLGSICVLLGQLIKKKSFVVDENGVSESFVYVIVLAFIFILPVKKIPWKAVTNVEHDDRKNLVLKLKTNEVQAGFLARLLLKNGFIFPPYHADFTKEELETIIQKYCIKYASSHQHNYTDQV